MFVSIVCDMGSEDSRASLYNLLPQYGFEKVQKACFECAGLNEQRLASLKRDIDRMTDSYDTIPDLPVSPLRAPWPSPPSRAISGGGSSSGIPTRPRE